MGRASTLFPLTLPFSSAFYNVSLDYIAGLTNDKKGLSKSQLSDYETEVIHKLRTLSEMDIGHVLGLIDALCDKNKAEPK